MHHAYCYASGHIKFGPITPRGAITIARGRDLHALTDFIEGLCRHGYDGTLLVPGVPEAPDQLAGAAALRGFVDWISRDLPDGIETTVNPNRKRADA